MQGILINLISLIDDFFVLCRTTWINWRNTIFYFYVNPKVTLYVIYLDNGFGRSSWWQRKSRTSRTKWSTWTNWYISNYLKFEYFELFFKKLLFVGPTGAPGSTGVQGNIGPPGIPGPQGKPGYPGQ